MGGRVNVSSELGEGTTFTCELLLKSKYTQEGQDGLDQNKVKQKPNTLERIKRGKSGLSLIKEEESVRNIR